MNEVVIIAAVRTPIGSFGGIFAGISAIALGSAAIKGALDKAGVDVKEVNEVFMGNVCSANLGQAPARQAALFAGLPNTIPAVTVNKVCGSGLKAVSLPSKVRLPSALVNVRHSWLACPWIPKPKKSKVRNFFIRPLVLFFFVIKNFMVGIASIYSGRAKN